MGNGNAPAETPPGTTSVAGGLFYGWIIVAATFVVLAVGFGVAYAFAAFFTTLQDQFGASRRDISLIFSIAGFLYFGLGALGGPLADRLGPRRVIAAGMIIAAIGLALASQASTLWHIWLTYGLGVGIGVGLAYVPAIGTVQRWFTRRRGLASGIAVSGIGVGTLAFPPLAGLLIDHLGWRETYLVLGGITALSGVLAAVFFHAAPHHRGLLPDGDAHTAHTAAQTDGPPGMPTRLALASRPFWLLYIGCSFSSFALFIPFVHLVPFAVDHGTPEAKALQLMIAIGLGSLGGRFAFGGVADRMGRRGGLALMFGGLTVMMLWWAVSTQLWALMLFGFLFGAFYGGFVALVPAMTADYFGPRYVASIIGVLYTSVSAGSLVGPTVAGYIFDRTHSYLIAIMIGAAMMFMAMVCMLLAPDPARWRH